MELTKPQRDLFRAAGLTTWLAVGAVFPACTKGWTYVGPTLAAYLAFAALFLWVSQGEPSRSPGRVVAALAAESALGLLLTALHPYYLTANLLVIVGWQAALILEPIAALVWILGQTAVGALVISPTSIPTSWPFFVAVAGFQGFGVVTARIVVSERAARRALATALSEVRMTQSLLAEAERDAERRRISRDIHDALGHDLTAIILQLDIAARAQGDSAKAAVEQARATSRNLLGEVRAIVGDLRQPPPTDIETDLRALLRGVDHVTVNIAVDPSRRLLDPPTAHKVRRIVQEGVTNALRHGEATRIDITLEPADEEVLVTIIDNGRGADRLVPGFGLKGLRERAEEGGGRLNVATTPGSGVRIEAYLATPAP